MKAILAVRSIAGILWLAQLVLGVLFWTGRALGLVQLHMALGGLFVLALWILAALAARAGAPRGLVVTTVVWGVILPLLGFAQYQLLLGANHWIIRVVPLLVGLAAMAFVGRLTMSVTRAPKPAGAPA